MEKSGQRPPDPKIIDNPALKTFFRKILEGSITILLWSVWLYFIAPAITVILWIFGIRHFWLALFKGGGFLQLLWLIKSGGVVILIIFILDMGWVYYNYYFIYRRLSKKKRYIPTCLDSDLASVFDINPEDVVRAKKSHRISLVLKDNKVTVTSA